MNVLSLFDGMSCGQIALERAGIKVDNYYASEIDKYAIKVAMANYPGTVQLGDIKNIHYTNWGIEVDASPGGMRVLGVNIDLIIGGSPCQGFSFAGKQLNFTDHRSMLFFEYLRIFNEIKKCNPNVKFLLENVEMKYEHELVISRFLDVNPIVINSSLVSAQNRTRNYWTNINTKPVGLFQELKPDIQPPKDKGILLKDILESGFVDIDKSYCIDANYFKGTNLGQYKNKGRRQIVFEAKNKKDVIVDLELPPPYSFYECRTDLGKESRKIEKQRTGRDSTKRSKEHKAYQPLLSNKANCLVTVDTPLNYILDENYRYRKLTPTECETLQTVPGNYTNHVSDTQRYKMLGNGWTVDIIAHILSHLKQ